MTHLSRKYSKGSYRSQEIKRSFYRFRKSTASVVGLVIVLCVVAIALLAPVLAPYPEDEYATHFERTFKTPSWDHLMGTDYVGRDILSRVFIGARISLLIGVTVVTVAMLIGIPLGLIAGYRGGFVEKAIMRITDIFLSLPPVVMALAFTAILSPNVQNSMFAISLVWWPGFVRLVQGQVIHIKEEQYVEASRSLGADWIRTTFKDIFPNCLSQITVKASYDIGLAILVAAVLGFLGLGAQPPTPEWGTMISESRVYLPEAWWLPTFPGLAIAITVLGFNLLGDGLQDFLELGS